MNFKGRRSRCIGTKGFKVLQACIEPSLNNIYMTNAPQFYIKVQKRVNLGTLAQCELIRRASYLLPVDSV